MTRIWTGTASVTNGDATVVLTGDPLSAANCPPDATIVLSGATYFVGSATYGTMTVELTRVYEGTTNADVSAEIDPMTAETSSRFALIQQYTAFNARLQLLDADGKGLFYTILGQTGANDPGPGKIARDADWAVATELYLDVLDAGGKSAASLVDEWAVNSVITVRSISSRAYAAYRVLAAPQDMSGWRLVAVEYIGGDGILADGEDVAIAWSPVGSLTLSHDAQVDEVADLAQFLGEENGFSVLVSDTGEGTPGIYSLDASASPAEWIGPAVLAGLPGPPGEDSTVPGPAGPPNDLTIGTVEDGPGADATITGEAPEQVLNLVLPKGDAGDAATIAIGTVTTVEPTDPATVTNIGTSSAAVLDFEIPKGPPGSGSVDSVNGNPGPDIVLDADDIDDTSTTKKFATATQLAAVDALGTASTKDTGTASGNVPVLDGSGKLATSILPGLALTEISEVASQVAMLALTAQVGDIAIRTDINKTFALAADPASTLANWKELRTPTDVVLSVAGLTGAISGSGLKTALGLGNVTDNAQLPLAGGTMTGLLTTNGQVAFPATQNPAADPNTLDDYEEGSWTPALTFGGNAVGLTYSTRAGRYVKIGRIVHYWGHIFLSAKGSSTGTASIGGLPFSASSNVPYFGGNMGYYGNTVSITNAGCAVVGGAAAVNLYSLPGNVWTNASFNNTTELVVAGSYEV